MASGAAELRYVYSIEFVLTLTSRLIVTMWPLTNTSISPYDIGGLLIILSGLIVYRSMREGGGEGKTDEVIFF